MAKELYSVNDIAVMSGLSTRTIRNYIQSGLLEGDKVKGCWKFTAEQINTFFEHPKVFPSILAKHNGVIFDFIADRKVKQNQICTVLDLPEENEEKISAFFCNQYNTGDFKSKIEFYYENIAGCPRIIIKGEVRSVMQILNLFYQSRNDERDAYEV